MLLQPLQPGRALAWKTVGNSFGALQMVHSPAEADAAKQYSQRCTVDVAHHHANTARMKNKTQEQSQRIRAEKQQDVTERL